MNIVRMGITENAKVRIKVNMKKFKAGYWLAAKCGLCALLASYSGVQVLAANTATINFTGTIVAGTCDLTGPGSVKLGNVNPSTLIDQAWYNTNMTKFTLVLSSCTGVGGGNLTPKITMTGNPLPIAPSWKNVFKSSGTSTGFGVVVFDQAQDGDNNSGAIANGDSIDIPGYGPGKSIPAAGVTRDLWAGVACGTADACARNLLSAGTLVASLNFTFAYK